MRIPSSVFAVGRYISGGGGGPGLGSPDERNHPQEDGIHGARRAYYAAQATVNFVRPGLTMKIVSANIAQDGTISVDYKITDPKGLPLDSAGITTPGAVSVSFIAAYIPKGQTQFVAYTTRTQTSPITKVTAIQAGADSGGTTKQVADGEYVYTFKTKAAGAGNAAWDPTLTHRIGIYGSRNLTEFDLGTNYDDDTLTWIPAGGDAHQYARRDPHGDLQQVPRSARLPWRFAPQHGTLHHVPHAADHRSRHREYAGYEGLRPQAPHGQTAAQREGRQALPDHRLQPGGFGLEHGQPAVRSAALRILPRADPEDGRGAGRCLAEESEPRGLRKLP